MDSFSGPQALERFAGQAMAAATLAEQQQQLQQQRPSALTWSHAPSEAGGSPEVQPAEAARMDSPVRRGPAGPAADAAAAARRRPRLSIVDVDGPPQGPAYPPPRPSQRSSVSYARRRTGAGRRSVFSVAGGGAGARGSLASRAGAPARSVAAAGGGAGEALSSDEEGDLLGVLDGADWEAGAGGAPPRRRRRWAPRLTALAASALLALGGALYLVYGGDAMIKDVQAWRLCFFLAGLPVIWLLAGAATRALVWAVERSMLRVRNALYWAYAARRPLAHWLRAALALGWWALMTQVARGPQDAAVERATLIVLRAWGCVTVAMTANLLKVLLAKALAAKLSRESHLAKIHETLEREYLLQALLEPRWRASEEVAFDDGGGEEDGKGGGALGSATVRLSVDAGCGRRAAPRGGLGALGAALGALVGRPRGGSAASAAEELLEEGSLPSGGSRAGGGLPFSRQASLEPRAGAALGAGWPPQPRRGSRATTGGGGGPRGASAVSGASLRTAGGGRRHASAAPLTTVLEDAPIGGARRRLSARQVARMERYVRRCALAVTLRDALDDGARREAVTSPAEARRLGLCLFWAVKPAAATERAHIFPADVAALLPDPAEAGAAFAMLDRDGSGAVTLPECVAAAERLFDERCDLALSLRDARSVVRRLESVLAVCLHTLAFFVYLAICDVDVVKTYLALSSLVLAFSFVFQNSIRTMYENVVFLFVVHPYDVGDVLTIEGQNYKVGWQVGWFGLFDGFVWLHRRCRHDTPPPTVSCAS
jgi:hypothetical protein